MMRFLSRMTASPPPASYSSSPKGKGEGPSPGSGWSTDPGLSGAVLLGPARPIRCHDNDEFQLGLGTVSALHLIKEPIGVVFRRQPLPPGQERHSSNLPANSRSLFSSLNPLVFRFPYGLIKTFQCMSDLVLFKIVEQFKPSHVQNRVRCGERNLIGRTEVTIFSSLTDRNL